MPRIRIRTPAGERTVGTPNCSTLTVQLVAHAQRSTLELRADAKLTSGARVLQRWVWAFDELNNRAAIELISEPGDRFDPPDLSYETSEPVEPMRAVSPADLDLEAVKRELQSLTESLEKIGAARPPSMQPSKPATVTSIKHCSFCGKGIDEVRKLIAGPTVAICDECIDSASDLVHER